MADITEYTSLITSEHKGRPKFESMVSLIAGAFVGTQNTILGLPAGFDLDSAAGKQLDVVGLWVGLSRQVSVPMSGVYFAWNTSLVGWNQGVWQGPFDPGAGLIDLDDGTYRIMLKAKIGANTWDGTIQMLQTILATIFAGTGTTVYARDYQDMSMDVVLTGTPPSPILLSLLQNGYFPLKPATVRIRGYVVI